MFGVFKSKEEKQQEWEDKNAEMLKKAEAKIQMQELRNRTIQGKHVSGLKGLATGTECKLIFNEDHIFIEGGGGSFRLSFEKVIDVTITTDVEFQKSYVSSVGGAVGGAALFGTAGAMIGGRTKEKTSRVVEHYAIVSYVKDGAIDCLSFHLPPLSSINANNIIGRYQNKFQGKAETQEL